MSTLYLPIRVAAGFAVTVCAWFAGSVVFASDKIDDEYFERHVRPLLVKRCIECHRGEKKSGGLSLESRADWMRGGDSGAVIRPGDPENRRLIDALQYGSLEMPPADAGGQLSASEIEVLSRWVRMGAPDPRVGTASIGGMNVAQAKSWWSFQPLAVDGESPTHPIDHYIDREIRTRQLTKSGPADKRTLIRRATYDLTGLPPTEQQVRDFLSDSSTEAFETVIDRLLDSPQYGVHWGRIVEECGSADCCPAERSEAARVTVGNFVRLDHRVWPNSIQQHRGCERPRTSSVGVYLLDGRRRRQAWHRLRIYRRTRIADR